MEYKILNNDIILTNVKNFDLNETFNCGQCFRWNEKSENDFIGVAKGKVLEIIKNENNIILKDVSEKEFKEIWFNYFDLGLDYDIPKKQISKLHPILKKASEFAPGIRILQQEPWEALCSFIISQNNNIPRIKGIVERLCANFGKRIKENYFTFPKAEVIANLTEDDLLCIRSGFRAKYILDAARKVSSNEINLSGIKEMPISEARAQLMKIKGVGPKVADCALLYGLHMLKAFPIDTWMSKAMKEFFPDLTREDFGEYAGIAQQYVFHYIRTKMH